jgi:hypothetical protein
VKHRSLLLSPFGIALALLFATSCGGGGNASRTAERLCASLRTLEAAASHAAQTTPTPIDRSSSDQNLSELSLAMHTMTAKVIEEWERLTHSGAADGEVGDYYASVVDDLGRFASGLEASTQTLDRLIGDGTQSIAVFESQLSAALDGLTIAQIRVPKALVNTGRNTKSCVDNPISNINQQGEKK